MNEKTSEHYHFFRFLRNSVKTFAKTPSATRLKSVDNRKCTPFPGKEARQDFSTSLTATDDTFIPANGNLKDDAKYENPETETSGLMRDDPEMDFTVNLSAPPSRGSIHMLFCNICPCDILGVWFAKDFAFGKMAWIKPLTLFISEKMKISTGKQFLYQEFGFLFPLPFAMKAVGSDDERKVPFGQGSTMPFPIWIHVPKPGQKLTNAYVDSYCKQLLSKIRQHVPDMRGLCYGGRANADDSYFLYKSVNEMIKDADTARIAVKIFRKSVDNGSLFDNDETMKSLFGTGKKTKENYIALMRAVLAQKKY